MPAILELLAPLTALVLFIIALGLTLIAVPLVRALLGGLSGFVGSLPIIGAKSGAAIKKAENAVIAAIGRVALSMEQTGVRFFHGTGQLLDWQAREIEHLAVDALRHWRWLKYAYLPSLILTVTGGGKALSQYLHALEKKVGHAEATAQHGVRVAAHGAVADRIVAVEHELVQWRGYTTRQLRRALGRLRALEEAVYGQAVALPGELGFARRGQIASLRSEIHALQVRVGARAMTAAVAIALARLGLGHLRCGSNRKFGKWLCGLGPRFLDELLGASFAAFAITDICRFVGLLQGAAQAAVPLFIELVDVEDALIGCHGATKPPDLTLPALDLPPLKPTLSLYA